jgi:hypothetical protein
MQSPEPPPPPPANEPSLPSSPRRIWLAGLRAPPASGLDVALRALGAGLWTALVLFALGSWLFPDVDRRLRWAAAQCMALTVTLWTAAHGTARLRRATLTGHRERGGHHRRGHHRRRRPLESPVGWMLVVLAAGAGFWLLGRYVVGAV